MGYLFTVLTIVNVLALLLGGWHIWHLIMDMPGIVQTAIADEVRKQDDRIEKRLARAADPPGNGEGTSPTPTDGMRAGVPWRR